MGNIASALPLKSEESALVQELRAGSEEAFAWLIARYHQPIYSLLARMLQDRADAADLTQEVFVKVFRGIHGFHGESALRTWIYRIALREASNQRRWWMRHRHQEVAMEQEIGESESGSPVLLRDTLVDPGESPFDKIIVSVTNEKIPAAWKEQVRIGGRIVAPVRESIVVLEKTGPNSFTRRQYFGFDFTLLAEE